MNGTEAIRNTLLSNHQVLGMLLGDLSDADLLVRPVPGSNHIAWQLGHLIHSEAMLIKEQVSDAGYPTFPADFSEIHSQKAAANDGPGFRTKSEYVSLFNEVRGATIA